MADAGSTARILIVDDNEDNRYTLQLRLELDGYVNLAVADDGAEAIAALKQKAYDLVLLDVMMPNVDGYGVLTWLKAQGRLRDLPVIMVSAMNEIDSVVRCIELGAEDYLTKPFNPVLLRARVRASLDKKRLRDAVRHHLERLETELQAARRLQLDMVPSSFPPPTPGFPVDIFATMEPAREVGGDLYDFFTAHDGTFCFLVGDVSGKGVPAALFMARTKNLVRLVTELVPAENGAVAGPAEVLARVNRELCQDNGGLMFVTLLLAMLDPATGVVRLSSAGHPAPYRLGNDKVSAVDGSLGPALGLLEAAAYRTGMLRLEPEETLYLYSDGITEAQNSEMELFSEARLESVLKSCVGCQSRELVACVNAAVSAFAADAPQADDITALAMRWLGRQ